MIFPLRRASILHWVCRPVKQATHPPTNLLTNKRVVMIMTGSHTLSNSPPFSLSFLLFSDSVWPDKDGCDENKRKEEGEERKIRAERLDRLYTTIAMRSIFIEQ